MSQPANRNERGVKLRAACDNCHAAKIRCSGEKTGCNRCGNLDLPCEYAISMVGKVVGDRGKNKRARLAAEAQTNQQQQQQQQQLSTDAAKPTLATTQAPVVTKPPSPALPSDAFKSWRDSIGLDSTGLSSLGDDPLFLDTDIDLPALDSTHSTTENTDITSWLTNSSSQFLNMDYLSNSMEIPCDDIFASPLSMAPALKNPFSAGLTTDPVHKFQGLSYPQDRFGAHRCILTSGKIVELLESKINNKFNPLDEVMRISKASISEICHIMETEEYKKSTSCPFFISIAMNLIISLFEACICTHDLTAATLGCTGGTSPTSGSTSPVSQNIRSNCAMLRVTFGSFQLDRGEQLAFCTHIIRKELQRSMHIVQRLKLQLDEGHLQRLDGPGQTGSTVQTMGQYHSKLYSEFELRLKNIMTGIESSLL